MKQLNNAINNAKLNLTGPFTYNAGLRQQDLAVRLVSHPPFL